MKTIGRMESDISIKHIWFGGRLGNANPTSLLRIYPTVSEPIIASHTCFF